MEMAGLKKMEKPKKTLLYMEEDMYTYLKGLAYRHRVSVAELVRMVLDNYIKKDARHGKARKAVRP
jgi:hypothetical protein